MQKLNELQSHVVNSLATHILLTASAGTGKTNTLAYRIGNILRRQLAEPEEILCLTFTNKACHEMQQRIENLVGTAGKGVVVRTFHSFCYDVIRSEAKKNTDIHWDVQIFDEIDSLLLFKDAMAELNRQQKGTDGFQDVKWSDRICQNIIGYVKEARAVKNIYTGDDTDDYNKVIDQLYEEDIKTFTEKCQENGRVVDNVPMELHQLGGWLLAEYDSRLRENHGMDFSDLIVNANIILAQEEVRQRWSRRFRFINIDEVQDTSRLEYDIISRIFGRSKILLCGDLFQTIFEWRGSDPEIICKRFEQTYHPESIVFMNNYRATRLLVNASFDILRSMFPVQVDKLYSKGIKSVSRDEGQKIMLYRAANEETQARWIYYQLWQLWQAEGSDFLSRVCVLTRGNSSNNQLAMHFEKIGQEYVKKYDSFLPFMLIDDFKFFRRQEIKDAMAFLRLSVNSHDVGSLRRIVKRFIKGIGPASLDAISSDTYRQAGIMLTDYIDPVSHRYGELYGMLINELQRGNVVVFDVESTGLDTDKDEIIQIAAIRIDYTGQVNGKLVKYLRATRSVGASESVHHISDAKLKADGEPPEKVLREFCQFAKNSVIVGHNVTYDITILGSQLRRLNLPPLEPMGVYDTLDIFRRFYPGLKSYKLEFLGELCQVKHKSSHDAFDDIMATGEILINAMNDRVCPEADIRRKYIGKHLEKFRTTAQLLHKFRQRIDNEGDKLRYIVRDLIMESGVLKYYKEDFTEGEDDTLMADNRSIKNNRDARVEHLRQLIKHAKRLEEQYGEDKTSRRGAEDLLKLSSLTNTEIDLMLKEHPKIPILTVHQVKGSEFDYVFLADCREGVMPSNLSVRQGREAEERRLFYVSVTRAKKRLFISYPVFGGRFTKEQRASRYIKLIPDKYIEIYK